jgi:hypothetical protein
MKRVLTTSVLILVLAVAMIIPSSAQARNTARPLATTPIYVNDVTEVQLESLADRSASACENPILGRSGR